MSVCSSVHLSIMCFFVNIENWSLLVLSGPLQVLSGPLQVPKSRGPEWASAGPEVPRYRVGLYKSQGPKVPSWDRKGPQLGPERPTSGP